MNNHSTETTIYIALVDDDPIANSIHQMVLQKSLPGVRIRVFQQAKQALEHIVTDEASFDLLLLDLNMPELNGWEFLQKLQQTSAKKPPVVILSSSNDPEDLKRSREFELVRGYWIKPLKSSDVIEFLSPSPS